MPYTRKIRQAKSTSNLNLAEMNIDVVLDSISKGAILDIKEGWWKTEYIVKYPEGGWYRIGKRIYDKLSKA